MKINAFFNVLNIFLVLTLKSVKNVMNLVKIVKDLNLMIAYHVKSDMLLYNLQMNAKLVMEIVQNAIQILNVKSVKMDIFK